MPRFTKYRRDFTFFPVVYETRCGVKELFFFSIKNNVFNSNISQLVFFQHFTL
jgi:hypothetical protein